jgi:hypothetical protein
MKRYGSTNFLLEVRAGGGTLLYFCSEVTALAKGHDDAELLALGVTERGEEGGTDLVHERVFQRHDRWVLQFLQYSDFLFGNFLLLCAEVF